MEKGYVRIKTVPDNRRRVETSLTKKGKDMKNRIEKRMKACEARLISQLSTRQVAEVRKTLMLLADVM